MISTLKKIIVNNNLYIMRKIISTLSLVFVLVIGVNANIFGQSKTIRIEVHSFNGDPFDKCQAVVQVKRGSAWIDHSWIEVVNTNKFSFAVTLERSAIFRVKFNAKQGDIYNTSYSRERRMEDAPNVLYLRVDFYIARSNYVLLEENDE